MTVRYPFISHEDLLKLSTNAIFSEAKELILEGLSFKLNEHENAIREELSINTEPRVTFDANKITVGIEEQNLAKIMGVQTQPDGNFDPQV